MACSLFCRTSNIFTGSTASGRLDRNGRIVCCGIAVVGACRCSCGCRTFFGNGLVSSGLRCRFNGAITHDSLGLTCVAIGDAVFTCRLSNGGSRPAISRGFRFDVLRRSCIFSLSCIAALSGRRNNNCIAFSSCAITTGSDFAIALRFRTRSRFCGHILCLSARSDSSIAARAGRLGGQCTSIAGCRRSSLCRRSTGSASRSGIAFPSAIDICRRSITLAFRCRCSFGRGCRYSSIASSRSRANPLSRSSTVLASGRGFKRGSRCGASAHICSSTTAVDRSITLVDQRRCRTLDSCIGRRVDAKLTLRRARACTRCVARCRSFRYGCICIRSVNRFAVSSAIRGRCACRCRRRFDGTGTTANSIGINHIHVVCARSTRSRTANSRIISAISIDCRGVRIFTAHIGVMHSLSIATAKEARNRSTHRSAGRIGRIAVCGISSIRSSSTGFIVNSIRVDNMYVGGLSRIITAVTATEHCRKVFPHSRRRSSFRFISFRLIHPSHGRMHSFKSFRCHTNGIADFLTGNFLLVIVTSQRIVRYIAIFIRHSGFGLGRIRAVLRRTSVIRSASNAICVFCILSCSIRQLSRRNNLGSFFVRQAALRVRYHISIGSVAIADRNGQSAIGHIVTAHSHINASNFRAISKLLCQLRVSICKRILHSSQRFLRIVINSRIRVAHFCGTLLVGHLEPPGVIFFSSIKLLLCLGLFGVSGDSGCLLLVVLIKRGISNTSKVIQVFAFHRGPCGNCGCTICAVLVQLTSGNTERCRILCIRDNVAKTSPLPVRHAGSGPFLRTVCRSASGVFKTELTFIRSKDSALPIRADSQVRSLGCGRTRFVTGITESGNTGNLAILIAVSDLAVYSALDSVIRSQVFNRTLRYLTAVKSKLIQSVCHSLTIRIGVEGFARVFVYIAAFGVRTTYKAVSLFFVTKADLAIFVEITRAPARCASRSRRRHWICGNRRAVVCSTDKRAKSFKSSTASTGNTTRKRMNIVYASF